MCLCRVRLRYMQCGVVGQALPAHCLYSRDMVVTILPIIWPLYTSSVSFLGMMSFTYTLVLELGNFEFGR